jgi:hypothetical protein
MHVQIYGPLTAQPELNTILIISLTSLISLSLGQIFYIDHYQPWSKGKKMYIYTALPSTYEYCSTLGS